MVDPVDKFTTEAYSFVDGSFNSVTGTYGCGGFLFPNGDSIIDNEKIVIQGSGNDPELASMRNVAGDIMGAELAIKEAIRLGLPKLTIH